MTAAHRINRPASLPPAWRRLALGACSLVWSFLAIPAMAAIDVSMSAGPSTTFLQNVKVRTFDSPGHQVSWQSHTIESDPRAEADANARYFFHKNFGLQGEFIYNESLLLVDMQGTQFGSFRMMQRRYGLLLSLVAKKSANALGFSSIYGSMGMGQIYAEFTQIPSGWISGGQMSFGADFASARRSNVFLELKYLWHDDVGWRDQDTGQHLKTSGHSHSNLANLMFGPHSDTQILGLLVGMRFKLSGK